jgi:omega-amidase
MKLALISLDQAWEDKPANRAKVDFYAQGASQKQAGIIAFPEMTLTGFSMNTAAIAEERKDSPTLQFYRETARKHHIDLIGGVVLKHENKATNNLAYVNRDGELVSLYSKLHPFSFAQEDKFYAPGTAVGSAKIGDLNVGFTICYDLRFPELYSALSRNCDLIINIANWPTKRIAHWHALLRARAIENQLFIAGVNRTGVDGKGHTYQKSTEVIDANGDALKPDFEENEMAIYTIDKQKLEKYRSEFPTRQDARPEFYKTVL